MTKPLIGYIHKDYLEKNWKQSKGWIINGTVLYSKKIEGYIKVKITKIK